MVDYQWRTNILEEVYDSQKEMADSLGVTARTIRNYKSGNTTPQDEIREKINRRWRYYKDKVGVYRELKVVARDPDTGEEIVLGNRTNLSDLEAFQDEIQEQEELLQAWEDSLKARGYTEFQIQDMKVQTVRFSQ